MQPDSQTADVRLGEGFAFFRWHAIKYGTYEDGCPGYGRPGVGCNQIWDRIQGRRL